MNFFRIAVAAALFLAGILLSFGVALAALPVFAFAFLVRAVVWALEPRFVTWNEISEFDPVIGWKLKPNVDGHYLTLPRDGVFRAVTDPQGWPGKATVGESQLVVFGDSFASGYGIDHAESFAELNRVLRIKVIGAPGYNMVQELLLMRRFASQLKGKLVVWLICVENDLIDNLSPHTFGYRTPFIRRSRTVANWEIAMSHINPAKWYHTTTFTPYQGGYLEVLAALCSSNPLSERAYAGCEYLIREGKKVCDEAGADLVVMTAPHANQLTPEGREKLRSRGGDRQTFDAALPDKKIGETCRSLRIAFVAGGSFLESSDYKTLDPHWNKKGHQRVAQALYRIYRERSGDRTETVRGGPYPAQPAEAR